MGQGWLEGEGGEVISPVIGVACKSMEIWNCAGCGTTRQDILCSPTLPEPELTPLRYLDPETGTTNSLADQESGQDPWLQEDPWSRES